MSKPPHTIDLPSLDDLFDDTFERNAARVLSLAESLERKYGQNQAEISQAELLGKSEDLEPSSPAVQQSWIHTDIGPTAGIFALGLGVITTAFATTLFTLNIFDANPVLDRFIWPIGLIGQVLLLIGFWLRLPLNSNAHHSADHRTNGMTSHGSRPFVATRFDRAHAMPGTPSHRSRRTAERL
ncbi:MAG: hypothetical protein MPJ50_06600 [Pirellulales bacterium]|nr:hypothetical protein [Pirellulales bacterium]